MDNSILFYLTKWNGKYELRLNQKPDAIRQMANNVGAKILYEGRLEGESAKQKERIKLIDNFVKKANNLGRFDIQELERRLSE